MLSTGQTNNLMSQCTLAFHMRNQMLQIADTSKNTHYCCTIFLPAGAKAWTTFIREFSVFLIRR